MENRGQWENRAVQVNRWVQENYHDTFDIPRGLIQKLTHYPNHHRHYHHHPHDYY